jgi:hypothetical protein
VETKHHFAKLELAQISSTRQLLKAAVKLYLHFRFCNGFLQCVFAFDVQNTAFVSYTFSVARVSLTSSKTQCKIGRVNGS